jgi:hypothetical protein
VKNSALVGRDLNIFDKSWVAPDADRVVRETTCRSELLVLGRPPKRSDLRTSVDAVDPSTSGGVPEMNMSVVRTTTSGEEVGLPRAPAESLDSSAVVGLRELGSVE